MIRLTNTPATEQAYHALIANQLAAIPDDFSYEDFTGATKDWEMITVEKDGAPIGFGIIQNKEIHFCISPEYHGRWLTKSVIRQFKDYDFEYTTVHADNLEKQIFVLRMGFKPISIQSNGMITYQLHQLKEV